MELKELKKFAETVQSFRDSYINVVETNKGIAIENKRFKMTFVPGYYQTWREHVIKNLLIGNAMMQIGELVKSFMVIDEIIEKDDKDHYYNNGEVDEL